MYPIIIKREPQKINKTIEIDLGYNCELTLADLKSHGVKNNSYFTIDKSEFSGEYSLCIITTRLETKKELKLRVQREEAYMLNYNKQHGI